MIEVKTIFDKQMMVRVARRISRSCMLFLAVVSLLTACGSTTVPAWQEQYDLGMQYLTDDDYASAIVAFTASIETGPKLAALYIARGDAYSAWAEETEEAALEALSDGETLEWSEITVSADDGSTYTLEELYENAISDYEDAVSLLESGEALDDLQDELLVEVTDKTEKTSQKEQESREKFTVEISGSEVEETGKIEITEYFSSYKTLVDSLAMEETDSWQFGVDTSYESNGFYLEWYDFASPSSFSMKNNGADNILLYGISLGDNISDFVEIMDAEGWWTYFSGAEYTSLEEEAYYSVYLNIIDDGYYLIEVVYDADSQIIQWYLNNWPEIGRDSEYVYEQVRKNTLRKDWTDSFESILAEYREACSAEIDDLDLYLDVALVMFYYHSYHDGEFYYIYYDINHDGQDELLVGYETAYDCEIVDIYTYDGLKVQKAVDSDSLGDRSHVSICTDGTIIYEGSGGALYYGYDFMKIRDDGYSIEIIKTYDGNWEVNPDAPYYDGTQYLTSEEMDNILNEYSIIDSNSFEWIPLLQ